jgi:N-dimethylarginine dimethylaminohydrolase
MEIVIVVSVPVFVLVGFGFFALRLRLAFFMFLEREIPRGLARQILLSVSLIPIMHSDMHSEKFNGHSMTGELLRVMVCPPGNAGWDVSGKAAAWRELGFQHPPDFAAAQSQHEVLCRLLRESGAEVVYLPATESLTLDAVYAHDASLATDCGLVLMNPGKTNRVAEARAHADFSVQLGIPVSGEIEPPGNSESGDMVWLDSRTLLIGHGYRTNRSGIEQMRSLFSSSAGLNNVEVLSAPLPCGPGPSACLHLMSLMSMLDERTILVDLPWLAIETVELLKGRGFRLIEIEYSERDTLACNVLALGRKRLIALKENAGTAKRLREAGFDVRTFPGSEICINGAGGPTCLTRPLLRRHETVVGR